MSTAISPSSGGAQALAPSSLATWRFMGDSMESAEKLATTLVKTGLAPAGMTAPQAFYILLAGAELGLRGPIEALRHIVVIKGKPAISAELMRALMLQAGCKLEWLRTDDKGATLKITRPDGTTGTFTFEEKDAQRAGLLGKGTWAQYAPAMYQARATSLGGRAFCADMMRGASYTPEELGAQVVVSDDGSLEVTPKWELVDPVTGEVTERSVDKPATTPDANPVATARAQALAQLYGKKFGTAGGRDERMEQAFRVLGHPVDSFKTLTREDGEALFAAWRDLPDLGPGGVPYPTQPHPDYVAAKAQAAVAPAAPATVEPEGGDIDELDRALGQSHGPSEAEELRALAIELGVWVDGKGVKLGAKAAARLGLEEGTLSLGDAIAVDKFEQLFALLRETKAKRAANAAQKAAKEVAA